MYYGRASESVDYFSGLGFACPLYVNPADYFLDMLVDHLSLEGEDEEGDHGGSTVDLEAQEQRKLLARSQQQLLLSSSTNGLASDHQALSSGSTSSLDQHQHHLAFHMTLASQFEHSSKHAEIVSSLRGKGAAEPATPRASSRFGGGDDAMQQELTATRVSAFRQTVVLTHRTWKDNLRDTNVMYVRTFAALFVSLLIGVIFWQQHPDTSSSDTGNVVNSILFLMTCFSLFALPSISKYIEERLLYTREHASGFYSTLPYVVAHFIVEIPILVATCVGYGSIAYWMVGFEPEIGHFIFFLVAIFVVIEVGFGMSQILSSAVDTVNSAIAIYVIFLLYSLLLGGFIIPKDQVLCTPCHAICHAMPRTP